MGLWVCGSVGRWVAGRRWGIARRFAGANEVVTMRQRFGACIIDAISHVAKRSGTLYGRFGAGILHNPA